MSVLAFIVTHSHNQCEPQVALAEYIVIWAWYGTE
jgi:hypothetical protein